MKTEEAKKRLWTLEDKIVAFIQDSKDELFTVDEIIPQVKRSRERVQALLEKLRKKGQLASLGKIKRGIGAIKVWGLPDKVWRIAKEWGQEESYEGIKINDKNEKRRDKEIF